MARITNAHSVPLLVGSVTIQPGRTSKVPNWDSVKGAEPVASWLKVGSIVDADAKPEPVETEAKSKAKD